MTRPTPAGRALLRWWPVPLAVGMGFYAALVPEPYALGSVHGDAGAFLVAALLLVASSIHPTRTLRLVALWWTAVIALGRAAVLLFNTPIVDPQRTAAGIVVWLTFAYLVTMLTLITELSAGPRETQPCGD
jgi:hypothetical protein